MENYESHMKITNPSGCLFPQEFPLASPSWKLVRGERLCICHHQSFQKVSESIDKALDKLMGNQIRTVRGAIQGQKTLVLLQKKCRHQKHLKSY